MTLSFSKYLCWAKVHPSICMSWTTPRKFPVHYYVWCHSCSPSYDSCRRCGEQTLSHTVYICMVCPHCGWSCEPSPGPDAWMIECRFHRYTVASLNSKREIEMDFGKHRRCLMYLFAIFLPECVIMWRFSWLVEINFLSHAWQSNISCTYNKRAKHSTFMCWSCWSF